MPLASTFVASVIDAFVDASLTLGADEATNNEIAGAVKVEVDPECTPASTPGPNAVPEPAATAEDDAA